MSRYRFHGLTLDVHPAELEARARLPRLWSDLSWHQSDGNQGAPPVHRLSLELHDKPRALPATARHSFTTESFAGFEDGREFYLSDRESLLHLRPARLEGSAYLAPSFFDQPLTLQYTFWSFAVSRLVRSAGLYALHAAGLVHPTSADGVLVIGSSGSGKTTLTLDAIQQGWRYVSDDAVLLSEADGDVAALGVRKHCYVDSTASHRHRGFEFGAATPDKDGGNRRRVFLNENDNGRRIDRCNPRILLFPTIVNGERSVMRPMSQASAFTGLLDASCDQLWDRWTMPQHLKILETLVAGAPAYELHAGLDVYRDSSLLVGWLDRILSERKVPCAS